MVWETICCDLSWVPMVWAFMMRSMLVDQPYWEDTMIAGVSSRRFETTAFWILAPSVSFIQSVSCLWVSPSFLSLASDSASSSNLRFLVGTHELEALELGELR